MKDNKDRKHIEVNKDMLKTLKDQSTDAPGLIQYPHSKGSAMIDPVDMDKIKSKALSAMYTQTEKEMEKLTAVMKPIIDQVNDLKKRVYVSELIYMAEIPFEPIVNQTYYLYDRGGNKPILSILSPSDWNGKCPFQEHLSTIKLLPDHTWDVLD